MKTRNKRIQNYKEGGITLIALVVTVIILLILAGITVSLVVEQNGLLQRAQTASNTMANATANEITQVGQYENDVETYTKDFVQGESTSGTSQLIEDGIEIGDYVTYNAASGAGARLSVTPANMAEIVQAIDTSTDASSFLGGATLSGTFSSSEITKWREISTEGGIVRIIGEKPTTNMVTLGGTDGFKYAEPVLNKISEIYGKGDGATGARSIKIEDWDLNYSNIYIVVGENTYTSGKFYKQIISVEKH